MDKDLPKGYTCTCGHFNEYTGYGYAHWTIELMGTCTECGKKWRIFAGFAQGLRRSWRRVTMRCPECGHEWEDDQVVEERVG